MPSDRSPTILGRDDDWSGITAVVAGFGLSGASAADTLSHLGAHVIVLDERAPRGARREQAEVLEFLGVDLRCAPGATAVLPENVDLVIASPGWRPDSALFVQATEREVPVWGDVELAWRLRAADAGPWLVVTGTNGKTTTIQMLEQILLAAGLRAQAVGNVGTPILEAVMAPEGPEVLAVELSSFQLHWTQSMSAHAAAVLNIAPDHWDWHGGEAGYIRDKARIYENAQIACVYNVQDEVTRHLVEEADVIEGARAIGFTTGIPEPGMVGVVDGILVDRAFIPERADSAAELAGVTDLVDGSPHMVANALAAAALARSIGVPPAAVRKGLQEFAPGAHRVAVVAQYDGVAWVDDSKATNAHAARASILGAESVVWIAGGLAKGARFEDLIADVASRLRAVVLIGQDREPLLTALAAQAPDVDVVEIGHSDDSEDLMDRVVAAAHLRARPGDTVLLAPGAASMDQFEDYAHRGETFAAAVRRAREG